MTHGFPNNPSPVFRSNSFPVENRQLLEPQDFSSVLRELHKLGAMDLTDPTAITKVMDYLSDFHLLLFLPSTGILGEVSVCTVNRIKQLTVCCSARCRSF